MDKQKLILTFSGLALLILSILAYNFFIKSPTPVEDAFIDEENINWGIDDTQYENSFEGFKTACVENSGALSEEDQVCTFKDPSVRTINEEVSARVWGRQPGTWQAANLTFNTNENALGLCKTKLLRNNVKLIEAKEDAVGKQDSLYLDLEENKWVEVRSPKNAPLKYSLITEAACKFIEADDFSDDETMLDFNEIYRRR